MRFFAGMDDVYNADKVPAAFISVHRLKDRKSSFPVNEWIMDSGAFRTMEMHGGYPESVTRYAELIRRFASCGTLLAAVAQDYMCEDFMLAKTGLTIADHQWLTIVRYDQLLVCDCSGITIMPVLQGYAPSDYVCHIEQYGDRLMPGMWVGVGSICRRNGTPSAIEDVLIAIKSARPDLRLHGFGVKQTSLQSGLVRQLLYSADSMAWSFAARYEGRNAHDPGEAQRYSAMIDAQSVQHVLPLWGDFE